MDNRDFRQRIKNHETPFNPNAWAQMEGMLNTIPLNAKSSKTQFRKYLIILFIFLLASTGTITFFITKKNISHLSARENKKVITKENYLISNTNNPEEDKTVSKKGNQILTNTILDKKLNTRQDLNSVQTYNSKINSSGIGAQSLKNSSEENARNSKNRINSQFGGTTKIINPISDFTETELYPLSNVLKSLKSNNQRKYIISKNLKEVVHSILPLPKSNIQKIVVPIRSPFLINDNQLIKPVKTRNKFFGLGVGYADINSNKGFYIGAGLVRELNEIIGFETNLSYLSTWRTAQSNSFLDRNHNLNFQLWTQLNVWKIKNHKASIEFAPALEASWTKVRKEFSILPEPPTEYLGISLSYNIGISYTYFLRNSNRLGARAAYSSSDSAFLSLNYFQSF